MIYVEPYAMILLLLVIILSEEAIKALSCLLKQVQFFLANDFFFSKRFQTVR